jgi:hypothetical protein
MTIESGIGSTNTDSGNGAGRPPLAFADGPMSIGVARRLRARNMSRQAFVAIRYNHERTDERPSNRSAPRHARNIVSCTASSASNTEPSIR